MSHAKRLGPDNDPLLLGVDLPLYARFHPLGFPLDLTTNHPALIASAREVWDPFPCNFDKPPLRLRLAVMNQRVGRKALPVPQFRAQGHLITIIGDQNNFAVCDYTKSFAFGWFTSTVVEQRAWFRWHFLEAVVYTLLDHLYLTSVHAACVARAGAGVLLCGESGAGKSTLSYACARRGWTFSSDDSAALVHGHDEHRVLGNPYSFHFRDSAADVLPELRGRLAARSGNGKLTIELPAHEVPDVDAALECNIHYLVFLQRDGRRCAELCKINRAHALERMWRDRAILDKPVIRKHAQSLRKLAQLPSYELRYGDLDCAVSKLESLVSNREVSFCD
jgi:hypothetical protein